MRLARGLVLLALAGGCEEDPSCDEDVRAQTLDTTVRLRVAGEELDAEVARTEEERERGWKHRACGREALLLQPPQREPLPIWGCELTGALDVISVVDAQVVAVDRLDPCPAPCEGCPRIGTDRPVDGVIETPANALEVSVGDDVQGLP